MAFVLKTVLYCKLDIFCFVLFKVAVLGNIGSNIQKGAVTEPDHEVTKANVFRLQLLKDKLHVSTLTDNCSWCKLESYFTIVFEEMFC